MDEINKLPPRKPTPAFGGRPRFRRNAPRSRMNDLSAPVGPNPSSMRGVTPYRTGMPIQPRTARPVATPASFNSNLSLKQGFAKEERPMPSTHTPRPTHHQGGHTSGPSDKHEVKKRRRPMGGAFESKPRTHTFRNRPTLKTGTDEDVLNKEDKRLRVIVLGGNEEVGRNMSLLEYGDDIILIDMGLMFPDEDMPGVDYIVPNISYLKGKEKNIRGVIITHAHYDHIGGIPHLMPRLGNPPIFATDLTCGIIQKRQEDHRDSPPLNLFSVTTKDTLQLGAFKVEFFGVAHSIPTSMGIIVHTPCGIIVHTGDFKLDSQPGAQSVQETEKMIALGDKNVLALMIDSTNASKPGRQLAEGEIQHNIDEIIKNAKGKIIIGTFASMIARVQQIILACERAGRKIAVEGFSMRSNLLIAQQLGYVQVQKGTIIDTKDVHKYPKDKIAVICTGAQGEERAVLMRIANHEHPLLSIEPGDTVVFSSSVIPGNERSVQRVKDTLYREGARVIHYQMMDVHAGGHAQQEDLKEVHQMIKPKYLIPIEGNYSFLCEHAKAAVEGGFKKENIFIADNGQMIEFDQKGTGMLTNRKAITDYVFVDGLGVGNTNQIVLRDRQQLSSDGVVIVVCILDAKTGRLQAMPDIISRGFVFMKEHQELITASRQKAAQIVKNHDPRHTSPSGSYLKDTLRDELGEFLFVKTEQRPMIIPVLIEV